MTENSKWVEADWVANVASTRLVTLRDGRKVRFARSALEGMLNQVRDGEFIPINAEHLGIYPPMGRWVDGEIVDLPDGESELRFFGKALPSLHPVEGDIDALALATTARDIDELPQVQARFIVEARNYEDDDFTELKKEAPLEVDTREQWSVLPPIEWVLHFEAVQGVLGYVGIKFVDAWLDKVFGVSIDSVVKWVKRSRKKVKQPERAQLFTLNFDLGNGGTVAGSIPLTTSDDAESEAILQAALAKSGELARFAAEQSQSELLPGARHVMFLWSDSRWRLAWYNDGESNKVMNWFLQDGPDPTMFLGRPGISGLPAIESADDPDDNAQQEDDRE